MGSFDSKGLSTKKLAEEIERIKKNKLLKNKVVSLADYRSVHHKKSAAHLLVVDDDETTRNVLKRLFEKEGFDVMLASDATELVKVLEDHPPELILLDINLPWVDGFELCKLLKNHEDLKDVPIVFISGRKSEIDKKHAFKLGAHDYLTKPFNIKEITQTVRTLINLHLAK
ncbi:MAG TPA: response regulator [Deltaproteobacteria bacterium]|nr:response regulator [Deltaproteobacteria bacterium]